MSSSSQPAYLLLGEILRPHGIRGELRVRVLTDYPERIAELETVYLSLKPNDPQPRPYNVRAVREHQGYLLVTFQQIADRTEAEALRGYYVMVDIENAVPLEDDEIYLYQLIGMTVALEDGEVLGEVVDVLETGANDVYVVHGEKYGEVLIPINDETLIETNTDTNRITVRPPEGLLPAD